MYNIFLLGALLVAFCLFAINSKQVQNPSVSTLPAVLSADTTTTPFLKASFSAPPKLTAKAVYAYDLETGQTLFSYNSETPVLPASTTKIATALVSIRHYGLDEVLKVFDVGVEGHKMGLVLGEEIRVRDLLYGLIVFSANDAAEVLAQNYPGGRENFVTVMNKLVQDIGLRNTHFTNPVGFDEYLHYSTAYDLARLGAYAMQDPIFSKIAGTEAIVARSIDGKFQHELTNVNKLIGSVPGVLGIKTGWTENAGESLVTFVERDGHRIIISLFGSNDRFGETKKMIDWIFENYVW